VAIHTVQPLFSLTNDPTHRLTGGQTLAESVAAWGEQHVVTERYQEAGLIHFYSGIPAIALPYIGRQSQYTIWATPIPNDGLFVRPFRSGAVTAIEKLGFERGSPNDVYGYAKGTNETSWPLAHHWQVYRFTKSPPSGNGSVHSKPVPIDPEHSRPERNLGYSQ